MIWNGNGVIEIDKRDYFKGETIPVEKISDKLVKQFVAQGLLIESPKPEKEKGLASDSKPKPKPKAESKAAPKSKPKPVPKPESMRKKKRGKK